MEFFSCGRRSSSFYAQFHDVVESSQGLRSVSLDFIL